MSHTFNAKDGTRFFYNSDLSGNVDIVRPGDTPYKVPGADLVEFVVEHIRREAISALEDMSVGDLVLALAVRSATR